MGVTDEIKDRIDIVDLVSESVELRRAGKNYTGFCPFHANTRTPSFVVFPDTQTWHCFGECSEGGDIYNFLMKKEGLDFAEALKRLAERAGVELKPLTPQQEEEKEENEHLRKILEDAVNFFRHNLYNTAAGKTALDYIYGRGLSDESVESFGLGYAPDSWDAASRYFMEKGHTQQELIDAGLASEREGGGIYDRFRHRLMIPIRDHRGRMAGFGARTLEADGIPKYLNSPQTVIFDKGKLLYGLDKARKAARAEDEIVIVEGYLGVLVPHQHGFNNIVATMGTALTDDHLYRIKRYSKRIILAMDSDAAGVKATLRGLDVAREALDKQTEFVFDARGLLRRESKLQTDLRVATLPPGMDPDDVVNDNPERWAAIIREARPIVMHVLELLSDGKNLSDPKVKSEIAAQVLPLIHDVSNAVERDGYIQHLARRLEIDERTLLSYGPTHPGRPRPRRQRGTAPPPPEPESTRETAPQRKGAAYEAHCVSLLLRHPELLYQADRKLGEADLPRIQVKDFHYTDYQILMELIHASLQQDDIEPNHYVINHLPGSSMELVDELLVRTTDYDPTTEKVLEDFLRALLNLRRWNVLNKNAHLRFMLENKQEAGETSASEVQEIIIQNLTLLHKIDIALKQYTSRTAALDMK